MHSIGRYLARFGVALVVFLAWPGLGASAAPDCPVGLPSFRGTITVHSGLPSDCVVSLPGGVILRAGGGTAPLDGRALFRVSGSGIGGPGGLSIVVTASDTSAPNGPELIPTLQSDAILKLPAGAELRRYDPPLGQFVRVPDGHIRQAGLYKVLLRGVPPLSVEPQPSPVALPATGSGRHADSVQPLAAGSVVALAVVAGLLCTGLRRMAAVASVMALALLLSFIIAPRQSLATFGAMNANAAHLKGIVAADRPPSSLRIPRLQIQAPIVEIDPVNGAWQLPRYGAGYLAGSVWPGHRGNESLAAHDDRDGSLFRYLDRLRPGDAIIVSAGRRAYRYRVSARTVVSPTTTSVLRPTKDATLTLITCTPYGIDTQRVVVRATLDV